MVAKKSPTDTQKTQFELSDRAQRLLKTLIEQYIQHGQPVGSKLLAHQSGLDLSPATVRNVLGELERNGYICSPHVSAGRIPTDKGYRMFVDTMLSVQPLEEQYIKRIKHEISQDTSSTELLNTASEMLSELTRLTSIIMMPKRDAISVRHVEFLPLSDRKVLAILVMSDAEVENRILTTSRNFSESELRQASNFLNEAVVGKDLMAVREAVLRELDKMRREVNEFMATVVEMASQMFAPATPKPGSFVVSGQSNLLSNDTLDDMNKARLLFEAFSEKKDILELLDQCVNSQRMQIFIGAESKHPVFEQCSLVTSPYEIDGNIVGVLGIIGPTRMQYDKVISVVDVTAKMLGAALQFKH